jgi:hypothetical protein
VRDLSELDGLSRDELIRRARTLGVGRAELMTRVELRDEIVRLSESDPSKRRKSRGWLGVARDLVASVVEQGLHLPEAAALIRGEVSLTAIGKISRPVATVTLAEIYAAQGHLDRALGLLDEVLVKEPEHEAARALRDRLANERGRRRGADPSPPDPDEALVEADDAVPEAATPELPAVEAAPPEPPVVEATPPEPPGVEATPPEPPAVEATPPEPPAVEAAPPEPPAVEAPAAPADASDTEPPAAPSEGVTDESWDLTAPIEPPAAVATPEPADVVVSMLRDGEVLVYWELSPASLERALAALPDGYPVVRVVALAPSWDGAMRTEHDILAQSSQGDARITPAPGSVVRAALGWRSPRGFRPFAVAVELALSGDRGVELRYVPPGRPIAGAAEAQERALARLTAV